jgi:2-polyprenyl-3-methyl-5-hydroxy-6-metoxy-1,4-benzoquinol methylase
VENCWRNLGECEPHWSVLTDPIYKSDMIVRTKDDFYASGASDVRELVEAVSRSGIPFPANGTCLELGCGVGRMTPWLARHFRRTIATDVSLSHLNVARQVMVAHPWANVELRLVDAVEAIERLPRFNCFFTMIVLQHNPPPVIRWLLNAMLGKLKIGGIGFFQVPTFLPG